MYEPATTLKLPIPVYGDVPPVADTVTNVEPPLQEIDPAVAVATTGATTGGTTTVEPDSNIPASGLPTIAFPTKSFVSPTPVPKLMAALPEGRL